MLNSTVLPYDPEASTYFAAIRDLPWAGWLDSAGCDRYDILVAQPVATLVTRGDQTEIRDASGTRYSSEDPFVLLRGLLGEVIAPVEGLPFVGGALGFWGYDLARRYHSLPATARDAEHLPEVGLGIYDWAIVVDHHERTARLVSWLRHKRTAEVLPSILERIAARSSPRQEPAFTVDGAVTSNLRPPEYRKAFDQVHAYLRAGDCYQVNLAQRYAARACGDAYPAYLELRRLSPAPFSAFLAWPQAQVLCASPERFLQVREGQVQTKPIKGTRARSADLAEDARLAKELAEHPKDRAENLMIIDLLRNDLGKNCEPGTVRVPELFVVESFAKVHHLVSTIEGRLQCGRDALDLLRDCFPGGSITGAPKHRAMEIIEQLEPNRRGVYCGAIGYVGYDGNMDTNIAIRTLVYSGDEIRCWAGGGVVADSQCDAEYQETLDKAGAMLEVLRRFGGKVV